MKKHYSESSRYMFNNMGRVITKYDMFGLASNAYLKAFSPQMGPVENAFDYSLTC